MFKYFFKNKGLSLVKFYSVSFLFLRWPSSAHLICMHDSRITSSASSEAGARTSRSSSRRWIWKEFPLVKMRLSRFVYMQ